MWFFQLNSKRVRFTAVLYTIDKHEYHYKSAFCHQIFCIIFCVWGNLAVHTEWYYYFICSFNELRWDNSKCSAHFFQYWIPNWWSWKFFKSLTGVLAAYIQLYRQTKYSKFPHWLDAWLKGRKQLGLLALLITATHVS